MGYEQCIRGCEGEEAFNRSRNKIKRSKSCWNKRALTLPFRNPPKGKIYNGAPHTLEDSDNLYLLEGGYKTPAHFSSVISSDSLSSPPFILVRARFCEIELIFPRKTCKFRSTWWSLRSRRLPFDIPGPHICAREMMGNRARNRGSWSDEKKKKNTRVAATARAATIEIDEAYSAREESLTYQQAGLIITWRSRIIRNIPNNHQLELFPWKLKTRSHAALGSAILLIYNARKRQSCFCVKREPLINQFSGRVVIK